MAKIPENLPASLRKTKEEKNDSSSSSSAADLAKRVKVQASIARVKSIPDANWDEETLGDNLPNQWKKDVKSLDIPVYFCAHDLHIVGAWVQAGVKPTEDGKHVDLTLLQDKDVAKAFHHYYVDKMCNDPSLSKKRGLTLSAKRATHFKEQCAVFREFQYNKETGKVTCDEAVLYEKVGGKKTKVELRNPRIQWEILDPIDLVRGYFIDVITDYCYTSWCNLVMPDTNEKKKDYTNRIAYLDLEIRRCLSLLKMKSIAFGGILDPIDVTIPPPPPKRTCLKVDSDSIGCPDPVCEKCNFCPFHRSGSCVQCGEPSWEPEEDEGVQTICTMCKKPFKNPVADIVTPIKTVKPEEEKFCTHLCDRFGCTNIQNHDGCRRCNQCCECFAKESEEDGDKCSECGKDGANGVCVSCKDKAAKAKAELCKTCGTQTERISTCKCGECEEHCPIYGGLVVCQCKKAKCDKFAECCICVACKACCVDPLNHLAE